MTQLTVIRHGETVWNAERRIQGHSDAPLNHKGRAQAERLVSCMGHETFDLCFSSDSSRALDTARPLATHLGLDVQPEFRLREWNLGAFEGLLREEVHERFFNEFERFRSFEPDFQVPEGESYRQFHERCVGVVDEICRKHQGRRLLIFSHGGVVNVLLRHALRLDLGDRRRFDVANTSVTRLEVVDDGYWRIVAEPH